MTRRLLVGDIFQVSLTEEKKKAYFQYVGKDSTQLHSHVILVFKNRYDFDQSVLLEEIIRDDIDFYAHTILQAGIDTGEWERVGSLKVKLNPQNLLFRDSADVGDKKIGVSKRWYVWVMNEPMRYIGELDSQNRKSEIGIVKNKVEILNRIKTGEYKYKYPNFE